MAYHKSSEKRARQDVRRNNRNRQYLSSVKTAIKSFREAMTTGGNAETATKLLQTAQTLLAKAAQKGLVHRNNASRRISNLAVAFDKYVKSATGSTAAPAAAAGTKKKATATKAAPTKKAASKKKAATKKKTAKKK